MAMYIYQNSWSSVLFSWTIIILYTDFSCNSLDIKFFFFFVGRAWRKRRASGSAHALPRLLRYAAKGLYELCLGVVLCLTKPAFMRRPWRITPCPAVHDRAFLFFLGIILQSLSSFAIRLLGSACALPDARRLRHLRCDNNLQFEI